MTLTCQSMSMMNECDGLYTFIWANFPNVSNKEKKKKERWSTWHDFLFFFFFFSFYTEMSCFKLELSLDPQKNDVWFSGLDTYSFFNLDFGFTLPIPTNIVSYTQISNSPVRPLSKIFCPGPHLICALMCVYLQSCPALLWPPMDCGLPGSSVCGTLLGRNIGVGRHSLL